MQKKAGEEMLVRRKRVTQRHNMLYKMKTRLHSARTAKCTRHVPIYSLYLAFDLEDDALLNGLMVWTADMSKRDVILLYTYAGAEQPQFSNELRGSQVLAILRIELQ